MDYGQDSPLLEAMAFNPLSLLTAALNNFWAWLAAVFRLPTTRCCDSMTRISTTTSDSEDQIQKGRPQTTPPKRKEEEGVLTRGSSSSKELFRVHFKEERENECQSAGCVDHDHDDEEEGGDEAVVKRWGSGRALNLTVEMRGGAGDLGWYGYQDMRVIDGSVVRLWEEERERSRSSQSPSPSPRRYRRRCAVGIAVTATY